MMYDVARVRADFPILKRDIRGKTLIYLDNAASTLKPNQVVERLKHYYEHETSNVHRGAHFLSSQGTVAYEGAREIIAKFLGAHNNEIIFTRGTTEGVNLVATAWGNKNVEAGDEIIVSELEHHSNIVPWQMLAARKGAKIRVIPINDRGELIFEEFEKLLSKKTKIVAVTWCSNALGTIVPIEKYAKAAHAVGAKILVDAAQAVSNLKTDVKKMDCDFLVFSGHKIFAPYGIGALYGKTEILEEMDPYQGGGSMISEVTWEKTTWAAVPHKFEAGTPAIADAIGLGTAIQYLESLGLDAVAAHEHDLLEYATARLREIPGLKIFGEASQKSAILSFNMEGAHASDVGAIIDQQGVAIRAGHHCCQPLMRRLGVPATARASFSLYNNRADIDALAESLIKAKEFF